MRDVVQIPGAEINEFLLTILSESKRPQIQCLSPEGEFCICSAASSRMVKNSFQGAKWDLGNKPLWICCRWIHRQRYRG